MGDDGMSDLARIVMEGPEAPLPVIHDDTCGTCQGTGWKDAARCPDCGGTGRDLSGRTGGADELPGPAQAWATSA